MSVLDLARPAVRALAPYVSARMMAGPSRVMLDANESPWAASIETGDLRRYPDPQPRQLCVQLAELYGVQTAQLLLGRGSDEGIDLLMRAFCRPHEDAILVCPPTFGMYAVSAAIQGAGVVRVPLSGSAFALDGEALLKAVSPAVKLVFLCSPNNPTGGLIQPQTIVRLLAELRGRCLLVVDEAYVEFAPTAGVTSLLAQHENLVVLRTLSKAWALAGARLGALLADARVIELLRRIQAPYPLPTSSTQAALQAMDGGKLAMQERVATVRAERRRLRDALQGSRLVRDVLPSAANFLTVRFVDAGKVLDRLAASGIIVRDIREHAGLEDALRITIGTPEENNHLLDALHEPVSSRRSA